MMPQRAFTSGAPHAIRRPISRTAVLLLGPVLIGPVLIHHPGSAERRFGQNQPPR